MVSKFLVPSYRDGVQGYDELFRCDSCSNFVEEIHIESNWGFCHDCYAIEIMYQKRRNHV
jgi:hypothetical protein